MNNVEIKKYDAKIKEIDKIINTYSESKNLGIKLYYVPEIYSENKIDYIAIKSNDEFYKIPTIKYNDNPLYLMNVITRDLCNLDLLEVLTDDKVIDAIKSIYKQDITLNEALNNKKNERFITPIKERLDDVLEHITLPAKMFKKIGYKNPFPYSEVIWCSNP